MTPLLRDRLRRLHAAPQTRAAGLLRRAAVQIEFARAFLAVESQAGWREMVDEAERRIGSVGGSVDALEIALAEVEGYLLPIGRAAKTYTIHCVGHGHIDMNWMWSWPETVATTHDTFASVLSFMREYPDLTFSQSQASVYALMERYHPALFEEIQGRVREGRWEVTATQWVEGDKNLASGESLARHLLYARRYFDSRFGLSPEDVPVAWEPDTFGHADTIPTILRQGAVKYYYGCRLGGGYEHPRVGEPRPPLFWWEGPDGSRLLVNRETTWYNSYLNIGENIALPLCEFAKRTGLRDWMNVFGIGNHGGGPTREEIDYLRETMAWPIFPTVRFGTAKAYFETIERALPADLPVVAHELNYEFTGCYTSQSAIKRANRLGEAYCTDAETLTAIGERALGLAPAGPPLRDAWIEILFNQFHDILPGSGVAATRERAMGGFQEAAALTGAAKRRFASALASRIDTRSLLPEGAEDESGAPFSAGAGLGAMESGFSPSAGGGVHHRPFVVFNPCAWERSEMAQADVYDADWDPARVVATDETGRSVRAVAIHRSADWGHARTTYLFAAEAIPPLGYRTYLLHEGEPASDAPTVSLRENERFETPCLDLQIDRYGLGFIVGDGTLGDWSYVVERDRGMSSWILGKETERRTLVADACEIVGGHRDVGSGSINGANGAYVVVRHARVPDSDSRITLRTFVHPLGKRVDFQAEVDWREIGTPLRGIPGLTVDFPSDPETKAVFETPFGAVERPNAGGEAPTLRFVHLPDARATILQDGKHGHAMEPDGVRMRVLRSSFEPDHAPEVAKSTFRYAVVFHDDEPSRSDLVRLGAAFDHPLQVFPATIQSGDLPTRHAYARVEGAAVLTGLKLGEEGGIVLRLVNYEASDEEVAVDFDAALVPPGARAETLDLIERPRGEARLEGARLHVRVPAHGFVSVRIAP